MKYLIVLAIVIMGMSGLLAQTVLIRELLIVFSGNELSIGIIFANWFILEAIGCFLIIKVAEKSKKIIENFTLITILFSLSLFAAVFIIRILKPLLGVSIGENIGFVPMFFTTLFILLPVSITHGALFPISCSIFKSLIAEDTTTIGKVYIYEATGTLLGGLISTYFLFPYLHTFKIISYLCLLNLFMCLLLLIQKPKLVLCSKIYLFLSIGLIGAISYFVSSRYVEYLHFYSIKKQFRNQNVVHYTNSIYANYCVIENQGQYIFFMDGVPALITPVPDQEFVEEFVHLPLLAHPEPKEVLIISGGAGGPINEVLKHPSVENIDYVELDPLLLVLLQKFSTPLTEKELNDKRVKIEYTDGILFLKKTKKQYDLILSGIMEPSTLQTNRFFTREFFALVKSKLRTDGIFVLGLPGALNYSSEELKNLNSCIFSTLKSVFPYIKVIPGKTNLFFASISIENLEMDVQKIQEQLKNRNIKTSGKIPWYIEQKLNPNWQAWFINFIKDGSKRQNLDFNPIALFYNITYWVSLFEPELSGVFKILTLINLQFIGLSIILLMSAIFIIRLVKGNIPSFGIPFAILTTGISGIIFDLMLIFTFQTIYGYVYSWIGILTAFFMAGSTCGAFLIMINLNKIRNPLKIFQAIELTIILFSICMPFIFLSKKVFFTPILFLIFSFTGGILIGSQFPLANAIYYSKNLRILSSGGLFYALDLAGGCLGSIVGAIALLPVIGLIGTGITIALIKSLSFVIITIQRR